MANERDDEEYPERPARGGHPLQPVEMVDGIARFKQNALVRLLLDEGKYDLNSLAAEVRRRDIPNEDWEQLMQLIGYSVGGFADLSTSSYAAIEEADAAAEALLKEAK